MIGDGECRRVARELKDFEFYYPENLDKILREILHVDDEAWVPGLLADLIEPSCDREALLTVAEELDIVSDTPVGSVTLSTHVLWDWLDRIRVLFADYVVEGTFFGTPVSDTRLSGNLFPEHRIHVPVGTSLL